MLREHIWHDRNFADSQLMEWRNVYELRKVKLEYMTGRFRRRVSNYVMVRLEDLTQHYQHFLHILQLWFNVKPKHVHTMDSDWLSGLQPEQPMPEYSNVEMDSDVADESSHMYGGEHLQHATAELQRRMWQSLDKQQEAKLGYEEEQ